KAQGHSVELSQVECRCLVLVPGRGRVGPHLEGRFPEIASTISGISDYAPQYVSEETLRTSATVGIAATGARCEFMPRRAPAKAAAPGVENTARGSGREAQVRSEERRVGEE